jgi:hypothetical protein
MGGASGSASISALKLFVEMAWLPKNPKPDGVSVLVLQTGE